MEQLKKEVAKICDQFAKEELGNRLSQFAMITFRRMLLSAVDQYKPKKEDEGNGA